jgi:hypothetical protein
MSGIQAWRNSVALFVNVDKSTYNNVFLEGGACMVWFAQNTQHADTPVIQRLLKAPNGNLGSGSCGAAAVPAVKVKTEDAGEVGSAAAVAASPRLKGTCVLLFCRLPGERYIYCGKLGYCRHSATSRPMKFVWRLLDFAALKTRRPFQEMFDDPAFDVVDISASS